MTAVTPPEPEFPFGPYWQTRPCPEWCAYSPHTSGDDPIHMMGMPDDGIILTSMPTRMLPAPHTTEIPPSMDAYLAQNELEREARVRLFVDTEKVLGELELTLAEARTLASWLTKLVDTAEGDHS